MKVLRLVLPVLLFLSTPAIAVDYQGKNMDGKKLAAKAYYYATGGVYNIQVRFEHKRATIYFSDGSQTTIRLKQRVITDPKDIEGYGKLGQFPLNGIFSVGLDYDNNLVGNSQPPVSHPLEGFWRISLE
ncbi:MAG: hypothetical protein DSM106950_34580 [Stigonema ocellatum SAG 48.90 = DSM 106950]|nr:hypothetical protein [Stigonema ocellatum SAG 48.90 = DSM 106950]